MEAIETIYLFKGVTSKNSGILRRFTLEQKDLYSLHRVSGTSQAALPSSAEMGKIAGVNPAIFFPPGIMAGLYGRQPRVDIERITSAKPVSIVYVDKKSRLSFGGVPVKMGRLMAVKLVIKDGLLSEVSEL